MTEPVEPLLAHRAPGTRARARVSRPQDRPLAGTPLDDLVLANLPGRVPPPDPADVDRRPRVGVVLGAGGVQGNAYHGGALAALWEVTGFEPRTAAVLVGTSAGSVHAAMYGAGMPALFGVWRMRGGRLPTEPSEAGAGDPRDEGVDYLADPSESLETRDIFLPSRHLPRIGPASAALAVRALARPWAIKPEIAASALLPDGMLTNAAVGRFIRHLVPSGWARHPRTWIVALNLRTGARTVFGRPGAPRSHLDRAVRASCAIPGFYRPVSIGRDRYVDGGMHSPSNADLAAGLDLDLVVVLSPMSSLEGHAAAGIVDRYLFPLRRLATRRLDAELRLLAAEGVPTLVLQPGPRDLAVFSRNLMDPRPRRLVGETALETTREFLAEPEAASAVRLLRSTAIRSHTA